jgi:hypothetical protein
LETEHESTDEQKKYELIKINSSYLFYLSLYFYFLVNVKFLFSNCIGKGVQTLENVGKKSMCANVAMDIVASRKTLIGAEENPVDDVEKFSTSYILNVLLIMSP